MPNLPKSSTLFHFTRSLDNLKGLLSKGFQPRYCLEDTRFLGIKFTAYPMVCFCDIPISRIGDHTSFYGNYGIGMTRDWGVRNGLNPLLYVTTTGPVPNFLNYVTENYGSENEDADQNIIEHFQAILALVKPLSGKMLIGGAIVEKDFYQESEWRFVPNKFPLVFDDDFESKRDSLNAEFVDHALQFSCADIKYIFVKDEAEIPLVFDYIQNTLGHFPLNDIKILSTRITSLETLSADV